MPRNQSVSAAAYSGYLNPFRHAHVNPERIDMGVDYQGQAGDPIYAIGPARVVAAGNQWAGAIGAPYPGTWIAYKMLKGPIAGRVVYAAEDINIAPGLAPGDKIDANTIIGRFTGAGQTETGFADPPGTQGETLAMAQGQASSGSDPGANTTAWGKEMSDLLASLGAHPGIPQGPVVGTAGGLPGFTGNAAGGGCAPAAALVILAAPAAAAGFELVRLLGLA